MNNIKDEINDIDDEKLDEEIKLLQRKIHLVSQERKK